MAANLNNPTIVDLRFYQQAEQGDIQACSELLSLAGKGWVSDQGYTPIQFAAANGLVNVFLMLAREREQDLHARQDDGLTLLHLAAHNGHLSIAKVLVDKFKVHVDETDSIGRTPLHVAAGRGHV